MKKLLTVVFTMLLAGSLAFAQATGGSTDLNAASGKKATAATSGKKATKTKKGHKGGKKSDKELNPQPLPPKPPAPNETPK